MRLLPAAIAIALSASPSVVFSTEAFATRPSSVFGVDRGASGAASLLARSRRGGAFEKHESRSALSAATTDAVGNAISVDTSPIEGMRPGTSGLRKKVEVWQGEHYVENFIQSLVDTAKDANGGETLETIVVAGDGRYYNNEAMQNICRVLAGNGIKNIWVPQNGIMSTPAVSAVIRQKDGGAAQGGIVLTASHNPGGPGEDFGIKYNEGLGQPAGEEFTDALYDKSLEIKSYQSVEGSHDIDLSAPVGTQYQLTDTSTVTIIDPFENYMEALKSCFDFDKLKEFGQREDFSVLFDGMHGAGGIFAQRVLIDELGLPESSLMRCDPKPDFGKCHPDPNLTYASELVKKMGLQPDGSADPAVADPSAIPALGAANDGDGDRNLIAGAGFFVTPSDSMALIADNWEAIPHFARAGGPRGVARSMPSSAALDVVAEARGFPCFVTPTGWKFFGNLMSSKEMFDKEDYTPFLCGEESFGTGSDHVREKDGLWAVLAWMSILMKANEETAVGALVGVNEIVTSHWAKYGRHYYCRYDYEGVDSDAANQVMDTIRDNFVTGNVAYGVPGESGIELVDAVEFGYTDPVDGSQTSNQGLILNFKVSSGDPARVVFRLSGTGSAGATIRMYLERFEKDSAKHDMSAPVALKDLAEEALRLAKMEDTTGRDAPTVIT